MFQTCIEIQITIILYAFYLYVQFVLIISAISFSREPANIIEWDDEFEIQPSRGFRFYILLCKYQSTRVILQRLLLLLNTVRTCTKMIKYK